MTTTHHATRHTTRHDTTHHEMPLWTLAHHLRVAADIYNSNATLMDEGGMPSSVGDQFRRMAQETWTWARALDSLAYAEDEKQVWKALRVRGTSLFVCEHDGEGE